LTYFHNGFWHVRFNGALLGEKYTFPQSADITLTLLETGYYQLDADGQLIYSKMAGPRAGELVPHA
jgi:hypothetical protein